MNLMDNRFVIKKAGTGLGKGLFAAQDIKEGEFLLEYTGVKIPAKDAEEMTTRYLFELDDTWTIDGSSRSNIARYINHSCDPNTEAEIRDGRIMIDAKRAIQKGEELTIDYDMEYYDEFIRPVGCKCGAAKHH